MHIDVKFSEAANSFSVGFSGDGSFRADFGSVQQVTLSDMPEYTGAYAVTPETYNTTVLPTTGKHMTRDVTVQKIPQFEVSNTSGGATLIIGEEYFNYG